MREHATFSLAAAIFMSLGLSSLGQAQIYQFTAPITGYQEAGAVDIDNMGGGVPRWAGTRVYFGTLNDTVYYDSSANTLRQVGSFSIATSTLNLSFDDSQNVSGTYVPASVSVDYTFNGGNTNVTFDSGIQPLNGDPTTETAYTGYANPWLGLTIPYTAACTLTTGGQTYSGSLAGTMGLGWQTPVITAIAQLTSSSLVIQLGYPDGFADTVAGGPPVSIIASNGLAASIEGNQWNSFQVVQAFSVDPLTATAAPEPNNLMLFAFGAFGLKSLWRRRAR